MVLIVLIAILMITIGVSYAAFRYSRTVPTTIKSGNVSFSFIEGDTVEIANAFPIPDKAGLKNEAYVFDVKADSTITSTIFKYDVTLLTNNLSETNFTNDQIKVNLVKNDTEYVIGTKDSGVKFSEVEGFQEGSKVGQSLVLEDVEIKAGTTDHYKMRIWISNDVNYSGDINEKWRNGR